MAAPARAGTVTAAPDRKRWLWSVLAVVLGLLTAGVPALEAYTPKEIFMLTCKLKSTNMTGGLTSPEGADTTTLPSGSHQVPVIYAQLDHSGGHHSDKINKSESVVYADI
uniref:Uncharacterized protein n=1 Tax=Macaca nemestrina TaxID=9545 RepID=A0A2K6DTF8_MACNE